MPSGESLQVALERTAHFAVGAHQDDLEIMAVAGIIAGYSSSSSAFSGVVATSGSGSVRTAEYASVSDEEMRAIRRQEQRRAAELGRYAAIVQLDHSSARVRASSTRAGLIADLRQILSLVRPEVVYTHSLFDAHATHRGVALAVIDVLRELPEPSRPRAVLGCEVWQDLDWLPHEYRVVMDVSAHEELQQALLEVFQSQIAGGKRYDLAALGRRRAHATFQHSHSVDDATGLVYAMDLRPLVEDRALDCAEYISLLCDRHRVISVERLRPLLHEHTKTHEPTSR
jgi:LmbE family N-acetylglucosaminyl deacetylase